MRNLGLEKLALTEHIESKSDRARQRFTYRMKLYEVLSERIAGALAKQYET